MKQPTTVYLYELAWILPSIAIPVGMLVALTVTAFGVGIHLPGNEGQVNPTKVVETPPFDQPGVVALSPGRSEVRMVAQVWSFTPNEIRVPAGSTVTFVATSRDVVHGLFIRHTNVNVMLNLVVRNTAWIPGHFHLTVGSAVEPRLPRPCWIG